MPKETWHSIVNIFCITNYTMDNWVPYIKYSFGKHSILTNIDVSKSSNIDADIYEKKWVLQSAPYDIIILSALPDLLDTNHTIDTKLWFARTMDRLNDWISVLTQKFKKRIFITTFPESFHYGYDETQRTNILNVNNFLQKIEYEFENITIIDVNDITKKYGFQNSYNLRNFNLFNNPYTTTFLLKTTTLIANLSLINKIKAIVVDCDDTLWKGIVGEDGPKGISCEKHNYPGVMFWSFQKQLLQLKKCGIILLICSKNNQTDIEEAFSLNPDFPLKLDDFSSTRIDWNEKNSNIESMAKELNIATSSMVFIDDNEFQCKLVENTNPEIMTLQFPTKDLSCIPYLLDPIRTIFSKSKTIFEDENRSLYYELEKKRIKVSKKFKNNVNFIKSLKLHLDISINDESQIDRISQLTHRTNQFNNTTIRLTKPEIQSYFCDKNKISFTICVKDKFGDYGNTGLIICDGIKNKNPHFIVFLLSCRILGKNLEITILREIIIYLRKRYLINIVSIPFKYSNKNIPIHEFLTTHSDTHLIDGNCDKVFIFNSLSSLSSLTNDYNITVDWVN